MDPTGYTPAGKTLNSYWNNYKNEQSQEKLDKVISFIQEHKFSEADAPLLEAIQATLLESSAAPKISDLAARNFMEDLPGELMPLLFPSDYSKTDLQSLLRINKQWNQLATAEQVRVAKTVERADRLPYATLLNLLDISGPYVHHLDLYRLFKSEPPFNVDQLRQLLQRCPHLQSVVVGEIDLGKSLFPTQLTNCLLEHFSKPAVCDSLKNMALISMSLGLRNSRLLLSRLEGLKQKCPNLKNILVYYTLFPVQQESIPLNLRPWMEKGKDIFRFKELEGKVHALTSGRSRVESLLTQLVPPDWFLGLTVERRENVWAKAKSLIQLSPDQLENFVALPGDAQAAYLAAIEPLPVKSQDTRLAEICETKFKEELLRLDDALRKQTDQLGRE